MIGIALLGAGFMADTHARCYEALRDRAQVRVVCGLDDERVRALAERLGSTDRGPCKLPPPFESLNVRAWGQSREQWMARNSR